MSPCAFSILLDRIGPCSPLQAPLPSSCSLLLLLLFHSDTLIRLVSDVDEMRDSSEGRAGLKVSWIQALQGRSQQRQAVDPGATRRSMGTTQGCDAVKKVNRIATWWVHGTFGAHKDHRSRVLGASPGTRESKSAIAEGGFKGTGSEIYGQPSQVPPQFWSPLDPDPGRAWLSARHVSCWSGMGGFAVALEAVHSEPLPYLLEESVLQTRFAVIQTLRIRGRADPGRLLASSMRSL